MLHYLDDLDSKMEAMRAQFEREAGLDGAWSGYNPSLGRPLLNSQKFLEAIMAARAVASGDDSEKAARASSEVGESSEPSTPQPVSATESDHPD